MWGGKGVEAGVEICQAREGCAIFPELPFPVIRDLLFNKQFDTEFVRWIIKQGDRGRKLVKVANVFDLVEP